MSAVATAEYLPAAPALEVVVPSEAQLAEREMYRWMLWLGMPFAVTAVVVGAMFATGQLWMMGLAIAGIIGVVSVIMWLAMTSCTNSELGTPSSSH